MVATFKDLVNRPDVCSVVYKLTPATTYNNDNVTTSSNNNNGGVAWKEFARLTTKGDPMTSRYQYHTAVRIEEQLIFTVRLDTSCRGWDGKAFVHDLSNYNN